MGAKRDWTSSHDPSDRVQTWTATWRTSLRHSSEVIRDIASYLERWEKYTNFSPYNRLLLPERSREIQFVTLVALYLA